MSDIREAAACHDATTLQRAAHTLKGSMLFLGATDAVDRAFELETMGKSGEINNADQAIAERGEQKCQK